MEKIKINVCNRLFKKLCQNLQVFMQVTSPSLCNVSAFQQVSKIFCSMSYVTNRNQ